ncbi:MAG: type II toxin-antitoxin system RelE/ParE family toxin [Candidatus Accumulibacter sp.]|nr:type II toxin-antitoxin system RelE/ParE family toxin [Accumulibacter sp.]
MRKQPSMGRFQEGWLEHYREWLIDFGGSGYAVWYRIERETIVVLAVKHQKEADYRSLG